MRVQSLMFGQSLDLDSAQLEVIVGFLKSFIVEMAVKYTLKRTRLPDKVLSLVPFLSLYTIAATYKCL